MKFATLAVLLLGTLAVASPVHELHARDGKDDRNSTVPAGSNGGSGKNETNGNSGSGKNETSSGNSGKNETSGGNSGKGKLNETSVLLPAYKGKPTERDIKVKTGQYFVKIEARTKDSKSEDRYNFYYTTLGFPRFYSSYFNKTSSRGSGSGSFSSWGYDMALPRLVEFQDKGEPGFDANDTIVSELSFSGRGRKVGWSPIKYTSSVVENATIYGFSSTLKVNETEVVISFAISSAQIRRALNSSTVLQPNSIKWDLLIKNYNYSSADTTLALETVVRSSERAVRITRNVVNRTETEVPHNRTLPANGTQISIGNGKGRIGFNNKTEIEDAGGKKQNGTVLIGGLGNGTVSEDLDAAESEERKERNGGSDDDDKAETQEMRSSNGNRTRLYVTFAGPQAKVIFWDPETNVADVADAGTLSATDVETAITQPGAADAIFDPALNAGAGSNTPPAANPTPNATPDAPKKNDASRTVGAGQLVAVAVAVVAGFLAL